MTTLSRCDPRLRALDVCVRSGFQQLRNLSEKIVIQFVFNLYYPALEVEEFKLSMEWK